MWPGHAPRDRVDRVEHLHAALLELGREVGDRALRLRDRHAVARHDDDAAARRRAGSRRRPRSSSAPCGRRRRRSPAIAAAAAAAEAAEEHVADRAVHRVGHLLGEDRAGRADEHAGHDQRGVVERDARRRRRSGPVNAFRVEITTGMSAPPIGSTSVHAQHAGARAAAARTATSAPRRRRSAPRARARPAARPTLSTVSGGKRRLAQASSCSLENATFEPQNEIEPMIAANTIGISDSSGEVAARLAELDERDQRHRAAADAVEQRHHLRHRGHLHAARGRDADRRPDHDADDDQRPSRRSAGRAASRPARSPCRPPRPGCRAPPCADRAPCAGPTMNSAKPTM